MPKLTIDGAEYEVEDGLTVLQACEAAGIEIPRFCYHEQLSIAGNCRMCLVGMDRSPKPVASCAMPAGDGMVVHTNTPEVRKMRKGVMEFLLINHPLDCPICDQGGECDLQDQAMAYGMDRSRYKENKRAVEDKYMGPVIKTIMTRCIHCTRCVRFATEIAGVPELGLTGRGEGAEITTYVDKAITSELSGCMVDLCPVGALTSKPYAFSARSWELRKTESVDVMDAVGSAIRVDTRGAQVMRVLPRLNEDVNEEWISDKTRYACDGLTKQRLDRPYVRKNGKLTPASWSEAFGAVKAGLDGLKGSEIAAFAGDTVDCESMLALKTLMKGLGSPNMDCRQDGAALNPKVRSSYLFNSGIAGIEEADVILLAGSNPRHEAAVLNARIRKRHRAGGATIMAVGAGLGDLTYPYTHLGDGAEALGEIAAGKGDATKTLKGAEKPMIIVGQGALTRNDGAAVMALCRKIAETCGLIRDDWNGFNVLHTAAARVGGLDLGFVPGGRGKDTAGILDAASIGKIKAVYLLGADEIDTARLGGAFVIYQGHHGDRGAHRADVILPGAAYTEKDGTFVNTEGRVQRASRASFPPGEAKEDWRIIRALSDVLGKSIGFNSIADVRQALGKANKTFLAIDRVTPAKWDAFGEEGETDSTPFLSPIRNFYMTDPISRVSATMAECSDVFGTAEQERTGADG